MRQNVHQRHAERTGPHAANLAIAALATMSCVACGSKGAVAVSAAISAPELAVEAPSALAARLTGAFQLHLALGEHASSGTDVAIAQGNFNLMDAARDEELVLLKFTTAPPPPFHLELGAQLDILFTIADMAGSAGQLLSKDEETAICASRTAVQIVGSITDSTSGSMQVASSSFALSRCP